MMLVQLRAKLSNSSSVYRASGGSVCIGRSPQCNVVISGAAAEVISAEHAVIEWRDGQFVLRDLHSSNGTFVNGARISEAIDVEEGFEFELGHPGVVVLIEKLASATSRGQSVAVRNSSPFGYYPDATSAPAESKDSENVFRPLPEPDGAVDSKSHQADEKPIEPSGTRAILLKTVARQRNVYWISIAIVGFMFLCGGAAIWYQSWKMEKVAPKPSYQAFEKVLKSTVWIHAMQANQDIHTGTGFVADTDRRWIVTNHHVVDGAVKLKLWFPDFDETGHPIGDREHYINRRPIEGTVLVSNPKKDLAIIELTSFPTGVRAVPLASDSPRLGQEIFAIGNPGAYQESLWVHSAGRINVIQEEFDHVFPDGQHINASVITASLDATFQGSSGGPAFNSSGELIGVVQSLKHWEKSSSGLTPVVKRNCISVSEVRTLLSEHLPGEAN